MKDAAKMLKDCITNRLSPVMAEGITASRFKDAVILPANINTDELGEQFINGKWAAPKWLLNLQKNARKEVNLLVIDDLTKISKQEQGKFSEILKTKKVGKFELPKNCTIIVLAKNVNKDTVNESVYLLCSHI